MDTGNAQRQASYRLSSLRQGTPRAPVEAFRRSARMGKRAARSPVRLMFRGAIPAP